MNLASLRSLLNDFTDEERHLEATAPVTDDPARHADLEQRARKIVSIVAGLGCEILVREMRVKRASGTAQWFDIRVRDLVNTHVTAELG